MFCTRAFILITFVQSQLPRRFDNQVPPTDFLYRRQVFRSHRPQVALIRAGVLRHEVVVGEEELRLLHLAGGKAYTS